MGDFDLTQFRLSKRELAVLLFIAEGMKNQEIALEMYVSQWTVRSHTARILQKLKAKNRAHAVAIAYHKGILEVPSQD